MAKTRKVRSVRIDNADNGYQVSSEMEPDEDDKQGFSYEPPQTHVFGHHEHDKMMAHVASQTAPPKKAKPGPAPGESPADWLKRSRKK